MTATTVNLRRYRKRRKREEQESLAEANRIAFGRTKAEKSATRAENERLAGVHDRKRIDKSSSGDD